MKEGEHLAYRVAIVDDSTTDAEFVKGILNSWADQRQASIQAEVFPSAESFLFRYAEDKDYQLLLLDIEMGDQNGIDLAKTIRFIRHVKVLERKITSKNFDFIGFNSNLEEFGRKNQISQKAIYRTQAAFEELCMQILLPSFGEEFSLHVAVSYAQQEDRVTLKLCYSGRPFNPMESDNILSVKLAQNTAEQIQYSPISDGEYTNSLIVEIK